MKKQICNDFETKSRWIKITNNFMEEVDKAEKQKYNKFIKIYEIMN